jgi:hypothetical protein
MNNPEIGMPLQELLGNNITLASTGASMTGKVLEASGFSVSEASGAALKTPSQSGIAGLVNANTASAPRTPGQ